MTLIYIMAKGTHRILSNYYVLISLHKFNDTATLASPKDATRVLKIPRETNSECASCVRELGAPTKLSDPPPAHLERALSRMKPHHTIHHTYIHIPHRKQECYNCMLIKQPSPRDRHIHSQTLGRRHTEGQTHRTETDKPRQSDNGTPR